MQAVERFSEGVVLGVWGCFLNVARFPSEYPYFSGLAAFVGIVGLIVAFVVYVYIADQRMAREWREAHARERERRRADVIEQV